MEDAIILMAALIIFAAGVVVGATWRSRRARPTLTLPDERP
jgi:hypothetical protein